MSVITLGGREFPVAPLTLGQMRRAGPAFVRIGFDTPEAMGAQVVELHTGAYCDAVKAGDGVAAARWLGQLKDGAEEAARRGLEVHAGHGIDFDSVAAVTGAGAGAGDSASATAGGGVRIGF